MKRTEWIIFLIVFALFLITWVATPSRADTTQNNTSGSNTSITGGYTNSTTYESGSSSASTTTNNTTSNIKSAPPTATAPGPGKQAQAQWKKYGKLRPDYDLYVKRLKVIEDAENNSKTSNYSDADE
jgi:hypothetical protein